MTTVHPEGRQVCHRWRYGLWHRHRIKLFAEVTVIVAQAERSIAKDIGLFFRRCNARHGQTFYDLGDVYVFNIGSICFHGKDLPRNLTFHQKHRKGSHLGTDVWHIWKVDSWTIRWFLECLKSTWKVLHGNNYLWSMNEKSSVSRMQTKFYVLSNSVLCLGKVNQNPTEKILLGTTVGLFQRFTTIQNFGHTWRRAGGIRVEYFPRIHHIAGRRQSPRVHEQNGRPRAIPRTNYLHVVWY